MSAPASSLKTYLKTFAALMFLLLLTVGANYIPLGTDRLARSASKPLFAHLSRLFKHLPEVPPTCYRNWRRQTGITVRSEERGECH